MLWSQPIVPVGRLNTAAFKMVHIIPMSVLAAIEEDGIASSAVIVHFPTKSEGTGKLSVQCTVIEKSCKNPVFTV